MPRAETAATIGVSDSDSASVDVPDAVRGAHVQPTYRVEVRTLWRSVVVPTMCRKRTQLVVTIRVLVLLLERPLDRRCVHAHFGQRGVALGHGHRVPCIPVI